MPEILKLAEFGESDRVAEVNVRGGGIHSEVDVEWAFLAEFFGEFVGADYLSATAQKVGKGIRGSKRHG